jgi:putative SOS response-associated peptidase YedK
MCNLYSVTKSQAAIIEFTRALRDVSGNVPIMPAVFPDFTAPIVRNGTDGVRELAKVRWGMPSSQFALMEACKRRAVRLEAKGTHVDFKQLLRMEPDSGTTNIRNVNSKHWKRWLGVENRCVVPFTSFSEFNKEAGGDIWFAFDEDRPLAFFAGLWVPQWTSVRKVKEGETTTDLYAFLTTDANAEVGAIHPKAMPVILRTQDEIERWMTAPVEDALKLQRPLPDGSLKIVAKGVKNDWSGE